MFQNSVENVVWNEGKYIDGNQQMKDLAAAYTSIGLPKRLTPNSFIICI